VHFHEQATLPKKTQRYALYLTVFWFRRMCTSKKTVRNTVNLSAIESSKLLGAVIIFFIVQSVMRADGETNDVYRIIPSTK
jgi:hypothetical protein